MIKINYFGATACAIIVGLIWGFYTSYKIKEDDWGEGMYAWLVIFVALAWIVGGLLFGLFQKENYERFKNETDDEYKRRMKRIERKE